MTTLDRRALEAAARELFESEENTAMVEYPEWDSPKNVGKSLYIEDAEAAITAYLAVTQPIVETVEELEGLPVGTVVEEDGGEVRIKSEKSWFCGCCLEDDFPNEDVILPARVIWRPHETP